MPYVLIVHGLFTACLDSGEVEKCILPSDGLFAEYPDLSGVYHIYERTYQGRLQLRAACTTKEFAMSTASIASYQSAMQKLEDATRKVEGLVEVIRKAADCLRDWKRVVVSNSSGGYPAELVLTARSINAREWPSAQELSDALVGWHQANRVARSAWDALRSERPPAKVISPPVRKRS